MRVPASLGWKAGLLLLALAIQSFAPQASVSVNAQAVPDVGVTAIELPAGPVNQGDTAEIKVTIENLGSATASVMVILNYLDAESTPGSVGQMMHDVPAGQTAEVSFSWDTTGVPLGSYTFQAVALSGENLDGEDGNHENNSLLSTDAVTIVAPVTYAVAVTAVEAASATAIQGATVNVEVTIENQGASDATAVVTLVYVPAQGEPGTAAEKTVAITAGAAETVTLSWDTSGAAPGVYTIRAGVALVEDANVSDSRDSAATITINPPPYAVAVTAVDVPDGPVTHGEVVDVEVTVKNQGTSDANAKITLLYVPAEGQPGIAAAKTVAIAAGAAETVTLSWDTSDSTPGVYTIRAGATLVEDSTVAHSLDGASTITIVTPPPYAIAVTAVEAASSTVIQGETVDVEVTVKNLGTSDANAKITILYVPAEGQPGIAAEKTVAIAAGSSETVTLSWDTSDSTPGVYTIRAGATLVEDTDVAHFLVSTTSVTISAPTYGVSITAFDVPSGPATQGYVVDADVTVKNLGSVAARFTVTLFDQPAGGTEGTADEETVEIAAAATKKVTLSWDTSNATPGDHTFRAGVTLVDDTNVSDSRDSAAIITISPPPYAVAITAVEVASATAIQGATVDVEVTVENQGTSDANAKITLLYVPAEGEPGTAAEKTVAIVSGAAETVTLSWDTSGAAPGVYTIRAGATLVEDTNVSDSRDSAATITISIPPPYAVAVTAVDVPAGPVTQGDTVNVDVTVENQGTSDANAKVTLLYVPGEGQPGTAAEKTVAIAAGAAETVTLAWDTSGAAPGIYTIRAGVTLVDDTNVSDFRDAASAITISALTYGVSITDFDVPSGPATQGYVVDADVTVENLSSVAARFTVTLFDQPDGGSERAADEETVEIDAGATKTVTLSWDTSGAAPGPHTFRAGAALVEDPNVSDSRDSAAIITINPPPYAVAVTAVEAASATAIQGATVNVEVTVENQGTSDANAAVTLLYIPGEGQPGTAAEKTVAIAAGAAETVTLSWDTSGAAPGVYTIRAGATLVEDTNVSDSRDSAATITISIPPPYAVAVTAVEAASATVIQGDTVNVDVTVENQGTSDANAEITVLYVPAEGEPGIAAAKTVPIAAGEADTITLAWDTSDATPGVYTIRAGATLVEDTDAADFRDAASTITIGALTYGVTITALDVPSGPATQGDVVDASVTVKNLGSVSAMFTVTLFDQPAGGPEGTADEEIVEIAAAATQTVTLSWDTSGAAPGAHTFRAGVTLVEDANVSDSRDSAAIITISVPPAYAVAVIAVDVASATVIQGDTVNVDVTVENQGTSGANAAVMLLYIPGQGQPGTPAEIVAIPAGESETVTLSWNTSDAMPGAHIIRAYATLVEDTNVSDSRDAVSTITIVTPPPYAVAVTAVDVARAMVTQGDTVDVDVTVENRGALDANAVVTFFYRPVDGQEETAEERTVASAAGAAETVTLSWHTSDTTPGVYTVRADATLVEDSNVSDSLDAGSTITINPPPYAVAITAVEVASATAIRGATVDVEVTVENQGTSDANAAVTLLYIPADGQPGIAAAETVAFAAGAAETVTLAWDTSDRTPGVYTVRASVTLVEDTDVSDSRDAASTITIETSTYETPTYGVAVTAVDVPTEISTGQVTQGEVVSVGVAIENRSSVAAMFAVTLFYQLDGGEEGIAAEGTFEITPGFTKGASLRWDTASVSPGVYTIRAEVVLVGVPGVDDVADSRVAETPFTVIPSEPTYGVSITAVDVPAGPVAQGETVDVDVTIENSSSVAAMFKVTLFYQPAGGQEVTAAEETVEIAAGAIETVTLNWDTSDATFGVYTIRAEVILAEVAGVDDVADSLVAEMTPITIIAPITYGVAVTAVDVPDGPAALGAEVDVDVTIENLGNTEVNAEVTLLYQPDQGQGGTADEETVGIAPGASVTITLSWDTSGVTPGDHTMRAGVTLVEDPDARDFRDSTSTITVISGRIILGDDRGIGVPDASFGGKLAAAPVETTTSPVTRLLIFGGFAKGYKTSSPVIETSLVPHDKLFTTNAQATFGSGLQNPFELGEIRVTVHLEERPNSLGSYVMVGSQIFFADGNGNCRIVVPSGVYDLAIQAPGYVSARIPGVRLGIGEAVTVPELTLPFGDSNGDGHIDILDLSIAAGNFGATMHQISLP